MVVEKKIRWKFHRFKCSRQLYLSISHISYRKHENIITINKNKLRYQS